MVFGDTSPDFHLPAPINLLLLFLMMVRQRCDECLDALSLPMFPCVSCLEKLWVHFSSFKCSRMRKGYVEEEEAALQRNEGDGLLLAKDPQRELLLEDDQWDDGQTRHDESAEGWEQWIKRSFISHQDATNSQPHSSAFYCFQSCQKASWGLVLFAPGTVQMDKLCFDELAA